MSVTQPFSANVLDGPSLFQAATEGMPGRFGTERLSVDYSSMHAALARWRIEAGWDPAKLNTLLLAIDPDSTSQKKFRQHVAGDGYVPKNVDYREAYVSLPPGRRIADANSPPITTMAADIAYIAGVATSFASVQLLVVTHAFEVARPLNSLAKRVEGARVGLAYFEGLLDPRWRTAGLLDGKMGIEFFDLTPHAQQIVGVDLASLPSVSRASAVDPYGL